MRGQKDSKSSTCTERAEVYAAGISVKVRAPYLGRSASPPRWCGNPRREARLSWQESAEGIVGSLDGAEGPNMGYAVGARASMAQETQTKYG